MIRDSLNQNIRLPDTAALHALQRDPAFDYKVDPEGESLWSKFMHWLLKVFEVKKGTFAEDFWTGYLWYILFAALVGVILYIIFKNEIRGFFYRKRLISNSMEVLNDDINAYDFDKDIKEAEATRNYRYAIRLFYLKNLKALNDQGLIEWKIEKTNADYFREITNRDLQRIFGRCTYLFNWIWYGDFPVTEPEYREATGVFHTFHNRIGGRA
jgi:hypothetical protein